MQTVAQRRPMQQQHRHHQGTAMMPEAFAPAEATMHVSTTTVTQQRQTIETPDAAHHARSHLAHMARSGRVSGALSDRHYKAYQRRASFLVKSADLSKAGEVINSMPGELNDEPAALILQATSATSHPEDWSIGTRSDQPIIPLCVKVRQVRYSGDVDVIIGLSEKSQSVESKGRLLLGRTDGNTAFNLVKRAPNLEFMKVQSATGRVSMDDVRSAFTVVQRGDQKSYEIVDDPSNAFIRDAFKRFLDEKSREVDPETYSRMYIQAFSKSSVRRISADGKPEDFVYHTINERLYNEFMEFYNKKVGHRVDMIHPELFGISVRSAIPGMSLDGAISIVVELVYVHSSDINSILAIYAAHKSGIISDHHLGNNVADANKVIASLAPQMSGAAPGAASSPSMAGDVPAGNAAAVASDDEEDDDEDDE